MEKPRLARQTTLGCLLATLALFGSVAVAAPAEAARVHRAHRAHRPEEREHRAAPLRSGTRKAGHPRHSGARHADSAALPRMKVVSAPAFDTCRAPSLAVMRAWHKASAYRAVGVYIGGSNQACGGGRLTAHWVRAASAQGWSLIPVYAGPQAPCVTEKGLARMHAGHAAHEGAVDADDAADRAGGYGLAPGSPIYFDLEAFDEADRSCSSVVISYIGAWTRELHADGYYSAVYGSAASGMAALVHAVVSRSAFTAPDAIWIARWNQKPKTADVSVPGRMWARHRRIKQFRGGHLERHGGFAMNVDNDYVDGPVARVS